MKLTKILNNEIDKKSIRFYVPNDKRHLNFNPLMKEAFTISKDPSSEINRTSNKKRQGK